MNYTKAELRGRTGTSRLTKQGKELKLQNSYTEVCGWGNRRQLLRLECKTQGSEQRVRLGVEAGVRP